MPSPLSVVIEGWHHLPHSYAMCTQYIELDLLRRPEICLYHSHIPYISDAWEPDFQLFSPEETAKLHSIPPRPPTFGQMWLFEWIGRSDFNRTLRAALHLFGGQPSTIASQPSP